MLFWTLALLMLAVAVLCVLLPLARRAESPSDDDGSVDLYLQQLADIDQKSAELEAPSEEIQQERAEIARRVLKQSRIKGSSSKHAVPGRTNLIVASFFRPDSIARTFGRHLFLHRFPDLERPAAFSRARRKSGRPLHRGHVADGRASPGQEP